MSRLIRHFETVESTNDRALAFAAEGAPDGSAVVADEQTSGRGRRGRQWHSPYGGLYLSYIVRDLSAMPNPALLTLAAGVSAAHAIKACCGLDLALKWPNDVVTARDARKVAGVLAEASGTGSRLDYAVIGIGVNVAGGAFPRELEARATSLELELGRPVERDDVRDFLLRELDRDVARLRQEHASDVLADWMTLSPAAKSAAVSWVADDGARSGVTDGIDPDGALRVRCGGEVVRLVAGEVIWGK